MRNVIPLVVLSALLSFFSGCAAWNHGKYQNAVENRYILVDAKSNNFGYKYMGYAQGFRTPIKGYVRQNGYPDFFLSYKEGKRRGIVLFYVSKNLAIDFFETNWNPDSVYPRESRSLTPKERDIYNQLTGRGAKPERTAYLPRIGFL